MCEPTTIAMAGLSAMGSMSAINAQNEAAVKNAANAKAAMNDQYADQSRQYIEKNRSLIQGGFDSILAGREAESDAFTSAIANGVQGASIKAMLLDTRQQTARSDTRTRQEMESLEGQVNSNFKNIRSDTQGRINSVSTTRFGLGDAAKALTPIVRYGME